MLQWFVSLVLYVKDNVIRPLVTNSQITLLLVLYFIDRVIHVICDLSNKTCHINSEYANRYTGYFIQHRTRCLIE